jgi:AcrR family transcriptional regulator
VTTNLGSQGNPEKIVVTNSSGSEPKRRRVRLSPEARKKAILEGAIEFFAEQGFGGQTRELADRLGVSQALLYRYFGSKEELIERVYEKTFMSRWNPEWETMLDDKSIPFRNRLKKFYQSYLSAIDDPAWIRIVIHSSLEDSGLTRRYIQTHVSRLLEKIVNELHQKKEGNDLPPEKKLLDLEMAWHLHSTFIYYLIRKHIHQTSAMLETNEMINMVVDSFLDGALLTARFESAASPI